jgi:hypothetical protein
MLGSVRRIGRPSCRASWTVTALLTHVANSRSPASLKAALLTGPPSGCAFCALGRTSSIGSSA